MENRKIKHSYNGMNQDTTSSQYKPNFYYEGKNIRINATDSQSTNSITNEKGNSLILTIPTPVINYDTKIISYNDKTLDYNTDEIDYENQSEDQVIIGHSNTRESIILFTTDNNGFDCIWQVNYETYDITLLYLRNLNFSINNPIQTINNFENEDIDKVYWVDGINQMRFINIEHSVNNDDLEELIDISQNIINMVGKYELSQPIITDVLSGGTHTAGMIQYAYNLYRLNSSQTKVSPLSKLIALDKGSLGGGSVNEFVGALPVISIPNIDDIFTHIKVYSIKYSSYNELPVISLIEDREIPSNKIIEIFDDGTIIQTISLEEFIFLGSDILIPKHINTKYNRLFFANYKEINFNVDLDTRAYSFNNSGISTIYDNLFLDGGVPNGTPFTITTDADYDNILLDKFDSINLDYDTYKYQKNGTIIGGEGKYIKYQLTQSLTYNEDNKYFKDEEIYRIGINFYNEYGQFSQPCWIADFKALNENLNGKYNTLKVTLKPEFFTWLSTTTFLTEYDKPVGYKIIIAERTINDRTIVANGLLSTMMINDKSTDDVAAYYQDTDPSKIPLIRTKSNTLIKLPNILVRNCNETSLYGNVQPLQKNRHMADMAVDRNQNTEIQRAWYGDKDTSGRFYQFNSMLQLHSPEILFGDTVSSTEGLQLRIKGSLKNHYNNSWGINYDVDKTILDQSKSSNGLSPFYAGSYETITNNPFIPYERGLVGHPKGSKPHRVEHIMYYRNYGVPSLDSTFSNNTILLTNDLTLVTGTETDPPTLITLQGKQLRLLLDTDHQTGVVTYTITPDVGFTSVLYNAKLTSDDQGNNVLDSVSGVTGTQVLTASNTLIGTTYTMPVYLVIESLSLFNGEVDVVAYSGIVATPEYIEYNTLSNPFSVNASAPVTTLFTPSPIDIKYDIYGKPELTEKGQAGTNYNNDPNYRYINSFESVLTDGNSYYDDDGNFGRKIVSIDSYGNRCVTLVTGNDNNLTNHWERPLIEDIFTDVGLSGDNNGLIGELVKTDVEIYLGNLYGGNKYEDKKRTNYIEIGDYKSLNNLSPSIDINSPGDTFVNSFKFLRVVKTDVDNFTEGVFRLEEIVEVLSETTVDLKNRNDLSLNKWDSKFQPSDTEYHKYNKVYSQSSNLIQRRDLNYNSKSSNNFDTNIITTKLKSSGETIDSWTDILPNEILTLDGKYGSINNLINFNDEIYSIQDKAFAFISISPRVQVQGGDGLSIQLGTGSVLDKYKYISTESGTINKWSVVSTSKGVYYYDLLNKSFMAFINQIGSVSDVKNMHSYFFTNTELNDLKIDNPLIKQGISSSFDQINNDVFMTFLNGDKSFTISFNELRNQFVSFYDYLPSMYISKGQYFITTNPDLKSIYRQYVGNYNNFYGQNYPSYVVLNVNPEANMDTVFDNIMYKSEVYLNDIDQPDKTLTGIRLYSEYQDSGKIPIPLIVGRNSNLRRKFRDWNAILPRNQNSRERIRNPWVKLVLQFDNTSNYKLILHDVIVSYSV